MDTPHTCLYCQKYSPETCPGIAWSEYFDNMLDMISIHDIDYRLVMVNQAFADSFSLTVEELVGKKCFEYMHKSGEPCAECPHTCVLKDEKAAIVELKELECGKYLHVSAAPIRDSDNRLIGSVHIARDMTAERQVHLGEIEESKLTAVIELAATIRHDLGQPLQVISGYSEMLMKAAGEADPIHRKAFKIREQVRHMAEVVGKLKEIRKYALTEYVAGEKMVDLEKATGRPDE